MTELDRREWRLCWNQALETGGVLVANTVRIEIEAEVVKQDTTEGATVTAGTAGERAPF
jgi:hypothetical protein